MEPLEILTYLVWLVASVTFILALKFLASPRTARTGNLLGAAGMALVVGWTFFTTEGMLANWWIVVVGAAIGWIGGVLGARRVPMTAMPQMVAIFNGAGGGAAALVAVVEFLRDTETHPGELLPVAFVIATLLGAIIGSVSSPARSSPSASSRASSPRVRSSTPARRSSPVPCSWLSSPSVSISPSSSQACRCSSSSWRWPWSSASSW